MTRRPFLAPSFFIAVLAAAIMLLHHARPVRAQQGHLQIASFSVRADQTLAVPNAPPGTFLTFFPDEHTTFFPPASSASPYLIFGASGVSGGPMGEAVVLESTDLQTFKFATGIGYNTLVMNTPVKLGTCNSAYDTEFDEEYAAPGSVLQDPTLPPGNLMMIYEAENHCPGGVYQTPFYATTGFARSSDNGKTWPPPASGVSGGPNRYPVLQTSDPPPTAAHEYMGDAIPSGFVDKGADGNYYLYAAYNYLGSIAALSDARERVARARLGQTNLTFMKWYNGSFSQPGIGGLDTGPMIGGCKGSQGQSQISYNDDLGLYLWTFLCRTGSTSYVGAWYYSTATSLDLQDWTTPQAIANSEFAVTSAADCNGGSANGNFDGWYPSFMSPGAPAGHTKLTGSVFFFNGCITGMRQFTSRTFTITTQPQPAPVLTFGSLANGATYVGGGLVPGSWAQVQGTGLANVTRIWTGFDFLNLGSALPTSLSGVQVMVNQTPASVYYISPTQVNFQVPTGISGTASVQVIVNGSASNTITASASASAPGLFPNRVNGVNYPAAVYAVDFGYVGPNNAPGYHNAGPGNIIELYATGLIAQPGGVIPTAQQINGVTVTIGTVTTPAMYAGQTAAVGEFQINFAVPQQFATMPAGNYPISISLNGVSSPTTINSNPSGQIVLPIQP